MPVAEAPAAPICYVAVLTEGARARALELARDLRRAGVRTELDARPVRLKAMLRRADHMGARSCALLGDDELAKGVIAIKDLQDKTQEEVPLGSAVALLAERLSTPTAPPGRAEGER
jgi:histidyl-tRNA synthetase